MGESLATLWRNFENSRLGCRVLWAWWAMCCWVWGHGTGVGQLAGGNYFCVRCVRQFKNKPRRCVMAKSDYADIPPSPEAEYAARAGARAMRSWMQENPMSDPLTDEQLAEIRKRLEGATLRPSEFVTITLCSGRYRELRGHGPSCVCGYKHDIAHWELGSRSTPPRPEDEAFIAHSPEDVAKLLGEVARLWKENASLAGLHAAHFPDTEEFGGNPERTASWHEGAQSTIGLLT